MVHRLNLKYVYAMNFFTVEELRTPRTRRKWIFFLLQKLYMDARTQN
jgi:hypothetical protein